MTTRYAAGTAVPADRSRAAIVRSRVRYGADKFQYGGDDERPWAAERFRLDGRFMRIRIPLPTRDTFRLTERGQARTPVSRTAAYEQAVRRSLRAASLSSNPGLEVIEAGISTLEQEILANLRLPNNQRVGEWIGPQVEQVYSTGPMPRALPGRPDPGHQLPTGEAA